MYLSGLNDRQKSLFLELCVHAANADNEISHLERYTIHSFCYEMGLAKSSYNIARELDAVLADVKNCCGERERRIMMVELASLMVADAQYDPEENAMMTKFMESFGLPIEILEKTITALKNIKESYRYLNTVLEAEV